MSEARVKKEDGMAVIRIPMDQVHALRVALEPIAQGAPTSTATKDFRDSLSLALARLQSKGRA